MNRTKIIAPWANRISEHTRIHCRYEEGLVQDMKLARNVTNVVILAVLRASLIFVMCL